jgi:asparagine synthase (glutamine-hydrolysing)
MCGICGAMSFDGRPLEKTTLESMTDRLRHRGPDDRGTYTDGPVSLGQRRLSIIDLSSAGHQPMADASGDVVVVFNGEIYNYRELRADLLKEGVPLHSATDTEVILYLYRKYGEECPKYLRGMFAFAIWDRKRQSLFIARDRIGIKPLYYYADGKRFAFASEMKAFWALPDFDAELSLPALITFTTYAHSFAPQTILKRVKKLPPGHTLTVTGAGEPAPKQYWTIPIETEKAARGADHPRELRALLEDAVRCHCIADVPVGVFLSGGLDSSVIAALAAKEMPERVQTFSVGFDIGGYYNELDDARLMAESIHSDHHELVVQNFDVPNLLEKLVWHYDEPFADAACLPTYILSEFARRSVKVVLSGEGGDEVFGGYRRYVTQLVYNYFQPLSFLARSESPLRRFVDSRPGFRRIKKVFESTDIPEEALRYAHWVTSFTSSMRDDIFTDAVQSFAGTYDVNAIYRREFADASKADGVNRLLRVDTRTWLPDTYLEKVDKATMAVGLEARVPLLDHLVVEHMARLPGHYKIRGFEKKRLLRMATEDIVPKAIRNKRKHGFAVPLDEWFRGPLLGFAKEILLDDRLAGRGYFKREAVERLIDKHVSGQNDFGTPIWQLLAFELWCRQYMDKAPSAAYASAVSA